MIKNKNLTGFTLIELLVVIVIIGILSTISISTFQGYFEKARLAKAQQSFSQVKRLFLAQNASTEDNLFSSWFSFDFPRDVNQTSPYIIDNSSAGNDLIVASGGPFSASDDTAYGSGRSLAIDGVNIRSTTQVANSPVVKITMASWFKYEEDDTYICPLFLSSSAGLCANASTGQVEFYINDWHGAGSDYISSPNDVIDIIIGIM